MSQAEPKGLYIYQPYGSQNAAHWKTGRIYAIGGLPLETRIDGLTRPEAVAVLATLVAITPPS